MTKTKSRRQKGGWGLPDFSSWGKKAESSLGSITSGWGWNTTPTPASYTQSPVVEPASYTQSPVVEPASYAQSSAVAPESSLINGAYPAPETTQMTNLQKNDLQLGGRRRKRKITMKRMNGGKGGLGLVYYASPVSGLTVAEPTYMIPYNNVKTGGKRSGHKRSGHKRSGHKRSGHKRSGHKNKRSNTKKH
jgi:hypothetical protein